MANEQIDIPELTEPGNAERFTRVVDWDYLPSFLACLRKASAKLLSRRWSSSDEFFNSVASTAKTMFNDDDLHTHKVTVSIESVDAHGRVTFTLTEFLGDSLTRCANIIVISDADLIKRQTGNYFLN